MTARTLLFTYGTLKRGGPNHGLLAAQEFRGEARTLPGYTLHALDGYPGMVRAGDDRGGVAGEVWAVDPGCLASLDELEGTDEGLYRREPVALAPPFDGQRVETYLYLRDVSRAPRIGTVWTG